MTSFRELLVRRGIEVDVRATKAIRILYMEIGHTVQEVALFVGRTHSSLDRQKIMFSDILEVKSGDQDSVTVCIVLKEFTFEFDVDIQRTRDLLVFHMQRLLLEYREEEAQTEADSLVQPSVDWDRLTAMTDKL